jgi:UPF0716 protein FxsA
VLQDSFRTGAFSFSLTNATVGITRTFGSFSQASEEASASRILAGQHFRFDENAGQALGGRVADLVADHASCRRRPRPRPPRRPGRSRRSLSRSRAESPLPPRRPVREDPGQAVARQGQAPRGAAVLHEARTLKVEMFVLALIGFPVVEVLAFIEVARAIGWLAALLLLLGTSVLGAQLLRIQGRSAIERVSLAVSEHRPPAGSAIDGALGFLGAALLAIPGFVTDVLGVLLLFPPTRALARRRLSRHYAGRAMSFLARTGRFAQGGREPRPADVDSTALDDDLDRLGR